MINQKDQVPLEHYCALFASLDPDEVSRRCEVGFVSEAGAFVVNMLNHPLAVSWPEFSLKPGRGGDCPAALYSPANQILVLRYLTGGVCAPAGTRFLSFRELPWGEVYDRNFQGRCIKRLASVFGSHTQDFSRAAELLGGSRLDLGDVSYELTFIAAIKLRIILHAGDDEFPPTSQILFSDNTALAFSAEDLAVAGDIVIRALKEAAGPFRSCGG